MLAAPSVQLGPVLAQPRHTFFHAPCLKSLKLGWQNYNNWTLNTKYLSQKNTKKNHVSFLKSHSEETKELYPLNMLWSQTYDAAFPNTILMIRVQTQFNQNENDWDWKVGLYNTKGANPYHVRRNHWGWGVEKYCRNSERAKSASVSPIASPSVHAWEPKCGSG